MEFMKGIQRKETVELADLLSGDYTGKTVSLNGAVHTIRDMGEVSFVILRKAEGLVQCVRERSVPVYRAGERGAGAAQEAADDRLEFADNGPEIPSAELKEESAVTVTGIVSPEPRAPHGVEIRLTEIKVLSTPAEVLPIAVSKWKLNTSLETKLALRPITLRNPMERAKFRIQEGIVRGFRDFLHSQGFTEIRTPKIVARGAEGGSNVFRLDYFNKKAELGQSPQFYKQTMVGVYDRVFEAAPVFRAEKHNTTRHLNEYTSLDFEMGYIDGFEDVMAMETSMLQYVMKLLSEEYEKELRMLKVTLPDVARIPAVTFKRAKELVSEKYSRPIRNPYDLEPEEEHLIGRYFKEEYDSDFVFVTHYPSKKRPFYAMDDPHDPKYTLSFDLLFKGLEITTGGQRIHDYDTIIKKMEKRGMDPEELASYLMIFKYGMPPHGGLGIGLERLTMRLLDEQNVRETTMFPRDVTRLEP
ncbi:MAG: aspartate--tRNA(Asn) ligase [Hungatella hathewayi]|uniref:aspartate--tRNA(Asn) ligase n=1 Tax=Hungatella TaxID=1649459 RepID=UPI001106D4C8|nr:MULTISPECIES: aspartate--tRNA(Asn) ligase [Hungatella]MCI7383760.1 aspartate--tRNA(Asn) ligase [Hungatella sp.]MDY6239682.1 aspartate--tRNA(Asn) ligase [Hungatella hathewayi]